jgi:hypothetical protein
MAVFLRSEWNFLRRFDSKSCGIMDFGLDSLGGSSGPYGVLGSADQPLPHSTDHVSQLQPALSANFLQQMLLDSYDPATPRDPELSIRGSWSQHEDELLVHAVNQLGTARWTDIAKFVHSRTAKQCRERWHNRLSPTLKREPFEPWEDQILIQKQRQLGNRWSIIAQALPGRSAGAVKNRWYAGLRQMIGGDRYVSGIMPCDRADFE